MSSTSVTRRLVRLDASPPDDEDAPGVEVGIALSTFLLGRGRGRNESAISSKVALTRRLFVGNLTVFGRSFAGHAFVTGLEND